jgi:hypothetical protein
VSRFFKIFLLAFQTIGIVSVFNERASAQSFEGKYTALLNCDKLPFTKAPLTNEPITLTISNGKVSYSRTLYGYDRNTIVGKEIGTGSIAADGMIELVGSWKGQ